MLLGNNSVTITLVAPADNGEPISNYEATCTSSDGGDTVVGDDPSTTIEVDGLTNGSTYTCAATATNVMGTSVPTPDSASFVAGQVPDAPVVTGVTRGVNVVTVAFTTPWDGSNTIRSYTATCTSSDGGTARANQGATSPITVGYLTNGNTYSCTVHAINSIGSSDESDPSDSFVAAANSAPAGDHRCRARRQLGLGGVPLDRRRRGRDHELLGDLRLLERRDRTNTRPAWARPSS